MFDRNGRREIGRVALKGTPDNPVYEWSGNVPPRVRGDVEAFIKTKGVQPRPPIHPRTPPSGGRGGARGGGGVRANSLAALGYFSILLDAISQYRSAQENGYHFNYLGELVIDDMAKAVQSLEQGTLVRFDGVIFKLKGDTFVSIDPSCLDCKLRQGKEGDLYIEGCKRCAEEEEALRSQWPK